MRIYVVVLCILSLGLTACDRNPGLPNDEVHVGEDFLPSGAAEALSQQEFSNLSAEQQYAVASKLLGTLYKGIGPETFFNLANGLGTNLSVQQSDFLDATRAALGTPLSQEERRAIDVLIDGLDENGNPDPDVAKYRFDEDRARQLPLARVYEYPLSRDVFIEWMAYFLVNTIMFSPALEMESTGIGDVQNTFRTLVTSIDESHSVRQIIRAHLPTVARWRVSRSPENHALEAFELYLGLFETEEDSRRGGIACKEWFLTDGDDGYQLVRTDDVNTDPQVLLTNYFVTNCTDLYDVVAGHALLMPRVVEVIVNYLLAERDAATRLAMVESIVNSGAETFEDIFIGVLFSEEYLLNTERPRSFEENALPMLARFRWDARDAGIAGDIGRDIFRNMASRRREFSQMNMGEMGWNNMSYKIGRPPEVAMDALSFANYHKAIRERIMIEENVYRRHLLYSNYDDGEARTLNAPFEQMTPQGYLDYLFMSALQRRANNDERTDLINLFSPVDGGFYWLSDEEGTLSIRDGLHDNIAWVTFDYISRLPEFYYFKAINQE